MLKITPSSIRRLLIQWLEAALQQLKAADQTKILCPTCHLHGIRSTVQEGASWSNAVHYPDTFDENGHRGKTPALDITTEYRCSNGHRFEQQR